MPELDGSIKVSPYPARKLGEAPLWRDALVEFAEASIFLNVLA